MAMLTNPGSRADLLLTLARLSLPDAVRRADQPVAAAILFVFLFLVFATAGTLGVLPVVFALESDGLRGNLLSLIACSVTAFALLGQVALRAPVTWLLDLKDLLRLPVGFRDLYGLRCVLSTVGYWLPVLGPAGVYLTVMRSGGIVGVPVTLFGILSLVWIFGRAAAVLSILADRWVEGALGVLATFVIAAVAQTAIFAGVFAFGGELGSQGITRAVEESAVLGALAFTPPGMVAGIVHEPGWSAPNLARLGGLLAILGALSVLENRLLLRSYLERPGGDRRTASGVLPLARTLRRGNRLTPMGTLTLLETECLLRHKPARLILAMTAGWTVVAVPVFAGGAVAAVGFLTLCLYEFRIGKQPPSCHVWPESLTLPFSVARIFRTPSRVTSLVAALVIAFALGLTPLDWFGWGFFLIAFCLLLAGGLLATAGYGLIQLGWPQRNSGFLDNASGARIASSFVLTHVAGAPFLLSFVLYALHDTQRISPLTAGLIAAPVLLLAAAASYACRRRQARVLGTRGRELLLDDADEDRAQEPSSS